MVIARPTSHHAPSLDSLDDDHASLIIIIITMHEP
jgi:hypothetical protein